MDCYHCEKKLKIYNNKFKIIDKNGKENIYCLDCYYNKVLKDEELVNLNKTNCDFCGKKINSMNDKFPLEIITTNKYYDIEIEGSEKEKITWHLLCKECESKEKEKFSLAWNNQGNQIGIDYDTFNEKNSILNKKININNSQNLNQTEKDLFFELNKLSNNDEESYLILLNKINQEIKNDPYNVNNFIIKINLLLELAWIRLAFVDFQKYLDLNLSETKKEYLENALFVCNDLINNYDNSILGYRLRGHIYSCFKNFEKSTQDYLISDKYLENAHYVRKYPSYFKEFFEKSN